MTALSMQEVVEQSTEQPLAVAEAFRARVRRKLDSLQQPRDWIDFEPSQTIDHSELHEFAAELRKEGWLVKIQRPSREEILDRYNNGLPPGWLFRVA